MDFIKLRKVWFSIAGIFVAASIAVMAFNSLSGNGVFNFGIDFTGGSAWIVRFENSVELADLRAALSGHKVSITTIEDDFSIKTTEFSAEQREQFTSVLQSLGNYQVLDFENIGPSAGSDLSRQAVILTILVLTGMLVYITFRFEFWTGLSAVLCLGHDVLLTLGFVSLLRLNFDISMIAAVLTIVGYSINATIIVFDRIREDLGADKDADIFAVADSSLHSVLRRCVITSFTTILAVLAIYIFGGLSIKAFALTMLAGFIFGTYSSIFLAAPLYIVFRKLQE